jgi:5'-nucleotidase
MLVTVRGVTIGLIGVTTIETAKQTIASNVAGLTFAPLAPAITREAMSLRARGAALVIVLAHAGGRCTRLE